MGENPTKKIAVLKVQDRTFKIQFVSNWVHQEWSKLQNTITDFIKKGDELQKLIDKSREISEKLLEEKPDVKNTEKFLNSNTEFVNISKKIEAKQKELLSIDPKEFFAKRMELIQEICESNDIEFDKKWWQRKTEPNDLNEFIRVCVKKDYLKKTLEGE